VILLKSREEIERMRAASGIVAEILLAVREQVRPGVSTAELDSLAEELTHRRGARPAFKGYTVAGRAFPASICVSINDEVVHGIPSARRVLRGGHRRARLRRLPRGTGDAAMTVPSVGGVSCGPAHGAAGVLGAGIHAIAPGARRRHRRHQDVARARGSRSCRVRRARHRAEPARDPRCRTTAPARAACAWEGLVLAIEPMVNMGGPEVYVKDDGWTAATRDGRLSAHFEHSVAVTADGPYILSLP
jgi:methionyl aminopeptidase